MANKMLIDAAHPEETRVVVLRGNRVEEFDFESASKKQLRGNIYLAKVTRVEPSLQAAFVDYGGNRHGFLAFSEIHPDYYQIPVADRQALLEDEARAHAQDDDEEARPAAQQNQQRRSRRNRRDRGPRPEKRRHNGDEAIRGPIEAAPADEQLPPDFAMADLTGLDPAHPDVEPSEFVQGDVVVEHAPDAVHEAHAAEPTPVEPDSPPPVEAAAPAEADGHGHDHHDHDHGHDHEVEASPASAAAQDFHGEAPVSVQDEPEARENQADDEDDDDDEPEEEEVVEQLGGDAMEEVPVRAAPRARRQYKIQEVIKRRQVLLVQVVKEERGNKGAALTTYLSLAGRYSVLMPNTARGGGISRKITDSGDRKRLKEIAGELEVPDGMGVILRTAGASRTKQEVRRDFEYLLRMWETVREVTLKSTAPTLVYEEGSLIKRSIRDLFNKDIEEIVVSGDAGFVEARNFMRLLMPGHAKNVLPWNEPQPLFAKFSVESQLDAMYSNHVTLKSGGYIVINQTEALVAIDVNSGRSTREHNIEDTALRTNLEAADEVARQLRLRDLAGLIVVDFIDMEEHRNNRSVERRIKDALKNDRARIQVGRISHFGLLEMSRQRIRTGVLEGSTIPCPHCMGSGMVRSTASIALHVLRVLEDALIKSSTHNITVRTRTEVALYILNQKRGHLYDIEKRFGVTVTVAADETLQGAIYHAIERGEPASPPPEFARPDLVRIDSITPELPDEDEEEEIEAEAEPEAVEADGGDEAGEAEGEAEGELDENGEQKRRRRRRRGRGDREGGPFQSQDAPQPPDAALEVMAQIAGDFPVSLAEATVSDGDSDEAEAALFEVEGEIPRAEADTARRNRRPRRGGRNRHRDGDRPRRVPLDGEPQPDVDAPVFGAHEGQEAEAVEAPREQAWQEPVPEEPAQPTPVAETPAPREPEPVVAPVVAEPAPPVPARESVAPEAAKAVEPPPAYSAPLPEAPVDPAQPKRSGWWQRAKRSFGGN